MKFASLGSGSEGNALLVSTAAESSCTTIMVDCGFGIRETEQRLAKLHLLPQQIDGIVVTHEHQDHIGGVFKFAQKHRIPVWLSFGTFQASRQTHANVRINFCRDGEAFSIKGLELHPFTVPHDAREPLQYAISDNCNRLGVLTDIGQSTSHVVDSLGTCDALVLECNHDRQMLAKSSYPHSLKQRIGGLYGHLSNQVSAEILEAVDQSKLKKVIAAHLSRQNNSADLAYAAMAGALESDNAEISVACQDNGFDWINLGKA
ncbi:MBL fold metallo-hydrolase [Oxalobacteraceae bacterium R-40]|uniref:MBL fold metallo-hydrolase n=1 Tax=Keguizhuia sedimenti TaxID=3064264 RepID=A0ABU1BRU8_9BURK|nr:MBL fold metallo-hydrolase [Oxalobacteraceae bacterium R-40]